MKKNVLVLLAIILAITVSGFTYDVFNFQHNVFIRVGDLNISRSEHTSTLLKDGRVLIYGGAIGGAELYNPKKRRFNLIQEDMIKASGESATVLNNGLVLIVGGSGSSELFNFKTEKYKILDNAHYPRLYHTATLLKDGRVLIVGGQQINPNESIVNQGWHFAEYSEIYDPQTEKFEIGPKLNIPRYKHGSILLDDGNVLIVGGADNKERFSSAEIYNTKANKFIQVKDMNYIRVRPQLIKLRSGKILIIGGYGNYVSQAERSHGKSGWQDTIEIYAPEKKEFRDFIQNKLTDPTSRATLLKNGNILFTAGDKKENWYYISTSNSAILNPETKIIVKGPDLKRKRGGFHTATLLNDGTVLITGGDDKKTAELYIP